MRVEVIRARIWFRHTSPLSRRRASEPPHPHSLRRRTDEPRRAPLTSPLALPSDAGHRAPRLLSFVLPAAAGQNRALCVRLRRFVLVQLWWVVVNPGDKVPNVLASEIGNLMPSYVTVIQQSTFIPYARGLQNLENVGRRAAVGEIAKRHMLRHPSNVIFNTKKLIGKKFGDHHVQEMRKKVPFGIVEGPSGEAWVEVHGMEFSPLEMTKAIFAKLKDIVQMNQFHHALKAVISVPGFFSLQQRKDVESAGNGAGFEVLQLIDESTAAALSSATVKEGVVVVFGMGAGSYSISILQVSGINIETKAQFYDPSVGGDQFDDVLLDYFVIEIIRLHSV